MFMKILNRAQFMTLPTGTVFAKYEPCFFDDLLIKGESTETDFFYQEITSAIECNGCGEFGDKLDESEHHGSNINMDFNCEGRDGLYKENQLFAVWSKDDVKSLINRLTETLNL